MSGHPGHHRNLLCYVILNKMYQSIQGGGNQWEDIHR
jgi:hypothetical protein